MKTKLGFEIVPNINAQELFSLITQNLPYATVKELIRLLNIADMSLELKKEEIKPNDILKHIDELDNTIIDLKSKELILTFYFIIACN